MTKKAKNILHVFSSLELGGSQRRFLDYVRGSKAGFKHTVYAMDSNYDALKDIDLPIKQLFEGRKLIANGNTWQGMKQARRYLRDAKSDLLITYNWGAIEWVLGNSYSKICPMVHIQDGFGEEEQEKELPKRRWTRALAYRRCNKVIVPSRTLEKLAQNSWKIPSKKLLYLPNGIALDRFEQKADPELLTQFGLKPSDTIIGTVCGLRPEKNIGRLIEAFSKVEDSFDRVKLVIVGDGIGKAALKMLAERVCTKGRVIFTGSLPNPEAILPVFDIFALSSDTEQMPLSVIEAMACGLPVVSPDVGDVREMVAETNCPYIEGREADVLAKNIIALLQNPEDAKAIGTANKAKATSSFSINKMITAYDTLLGSLIKD